MVTGLLWTAPIAISKSLKIHWSTVFSGIRAILGESLGQLQVIQAGLGQLPEVQDLDFHIARLEDTRVSDSQAPEAEGGSAWGGGVQFGVPPIKAF